MLSYVALFLFGGIKEEEEEKSVVSYVNMGKHNYSEFHTKFQTIFEGNSLSISFHTQ